jgi:hypothetical protein
MFECLNLGYFDKYKGKLSLIKPWRPVELSGIEDPTLSKK